MCRGTDDLARKVAPRPRKRYARRTGRTAVALLLGLSVFLSGLATGDELPDAPSGALQVPAAPEALPPDTRLSQETEQQAQPSGSPIVPEVPRPEFMDRRPHIPDFLLSNKREGTYVTAVPAIGWDAEEGFGLGVLAEYYDNGSKDDPFFRTAPYRKNISVLVRVTTEAVQTYALWLDQPYLSDSPYRLRAGIVYEASDLRSYFGRGGDAMRDLNFPGAPGQTFTRYDDFSTALRREEDGFAYTKYDQWKSKDITGAVSVERDMFGGIIRPLIGFRVNYIDVDDYTGEQVEAKASDGSDRKATQLPTKLVEDCKAGLISGCNGGWDNLLKLGVSLDTRDFEPDPTSGVLAQVTSQFSMKILGSSRNYQRLTLSAAGFYSLLPKVARMVLATRGVYSMQFGDIPFYSLGWLTFTVRDQVGLGGFNTMRGYKRQRFIGDSAVLVNSELRWSITDGGHLWGQHLRPMLVPFVEAGRVFDDVDLEFRNWRATYGIGFRLAWNLATIVSFDVGIGQEEEVFYMELGHPF